MYGDFEFRTREPIHIDSMVEVAIFDPRTHHVASLEQPAVKST